MGAPSSHLEATGKSMSRNNMTPEEVISSAEHINSPRKYVGTNYGMEAVKPEKGTLIGRKNKQAGDPTAGGKANRKNVLAGNAAASERMGAAYSVSQKFPKGTEPAAGPTMANARTVPSVAGRQAPNFNSAMGESY
jgi:hypothetical protein